MVYILVKDIFGNLQRKLSLTELEEYYSRDFYETPINKGLAYIPIREDITQIGRAHV